MTEWQPIETAPEGGVIIYSYRDGGVWCVGLAYRDVSGNWRNTEGGFALATPTHWMPLPEPPKMTESALSPRECRAIARALRCWFGADAARVERGLWMLAHNDDVPPCILRGLATDVAALRGD